MDSGAKEVVILYSGGLDSYLAYFYAVHSGYKPTLLHVDYGQPYANQEYAACVSMELPFLEVEIRGLWPLLEKRMDNHIVPSRNALLITLGGMIGEIVWLCALDGEQLGEERDKSDVFYDTMTGLLTLTNKHFTEKTVAETPFRYMSKKEVIEFGIDFGVPVEHMRETTSCYEPTASGKQCGKCLTCYKRYVAFLLNGVDTLDDFEANPLLSDYAKEMAREIPLASRRHDFSRFTPKRIAEHFQLLQYLPKEIDCE